MPKIVTRDYVLTGPAIVLIYSESEMAQALGIERGELREAIGRGDLCYHLSPMANTQDEGYEFNPGAYQKNIAMWNCLQSGGHFMEFDHYYDERLGKAVYKCSNCPKERFD